MKAKAQYKAYFFVVNIIIETVEDWVEAEVELYTSDPAAENFWTDWISPVVDLPTASIGATTKHAITRLPGLAKLRIGINPLTLKKAKVKIVLWKH